MNITKTEFGKVGNETVYLFTLENDKGLKTSITNYGGIMTTLFVPDKSGKNEDIVLGFDNLGDYLKEHPYFGALIGRYGNRIAKGSFKVDNQTYHVAVNNGPNHLHGGLKGFDKVIWKAQEIKEKEKVGLKLSYLSKDMEEGYPGNLSVEVVYYINNNNEVGMEYFASTDKKTIINLTQHNYYNLNACKGDVKDHVLTLYTSKYTPVDDGSIPTGEIANVEGTAFDFRKPKKIGKEIDQAGGYDHNFVIDNYNGALNLIARAEDPASGRVMEVYTTQPATQFYSSNYLDGSLIGKYGIQYKKHFAFCLETQHFPDSPNEPHFPSTILEPGKKYHEHTVYKFSIK
ncbi:MAG TPA: aldose epimerase family protein [Bacteroidales bacterium]